MQSNPSAVNETALLGLLTLLVVGITVSPDKSPRRRWLYWLGAPLTMTVVLGLMAHSLLDGVIFGLMGLVVLAITYGIRRIIAKLFAPAASGHDRLVRAGFRLVVLSVAAVALAVLSWFWFQAGKYGHSLTGVLGCLALTNMAAAIKTSDELDEMTVSPDSHGITFTPPVLQRVLSATLQLLIGVTLACWGYLQVTGKLSWGYSSNDHGRRRDGLLPFLIGLLGVLGVFQSAYGLFKLYDLRNPAFLRVDASGIRASDGRWSNRFLAWDDIDRIPPGLPVRYTTRYTPSAYVYPRNGRKLSPPPSLGSSDNGFRLTNLMRFYWRNPQQRNELTNGQALRRLRAGEFEPGLPAPGDE